MMNVLAIVQSALDEMGLPYPASLTSTTDPLQRQAKALLYAACRYFRSQRTFAQLKKKHSITLTAARYQYPLPSDYYSALPDTQWDEDNNWRLIGPLNDASMTDRTIGLNSVTTRIAYRVFGPDLNPASTAGQFKVDPVPSASGGILSFEYITRNTFVDATYVTFAETIAANTDLCLFDDDLMVAEFKWRFLRAQKKDYAEEKAEAVGMLDTAVSRWSGSFRGSFTGKKSQRPYQLPDGSWSL